MSIPSLPTTFTPIPGAGAKLRVGDAGGSSAPNVIAHLSDVVCGEIQVGKMDTTNHDSGRIKTQLPGEITFGDTTATAYYDVTVAAWLAGAVQSRTIYFWEIELSDTSTVYINGYISTFGITSPLDGNQAMMTKIAITSTDGVLDFTPAA